MVPNNSHTLALFFKRIQQNLKMNQDIALRVLYGSIFVAQDPEAIGGRRCFSRVGGRESTRFPDHLGFSEATPKGTGRAVPADATADAGDGNDEAGAGGPGWKQVQGQREQAQGHELRTDGGDQEAAARGSAQ